MTITDTPAPTDAVTRDRITALATGFQFAARHIRKCGAGDMEILGRVRLPEPHPYMIPVIKGDDDERRARVDEWAARHGITAATDEATGHYRAELPFGPLKVIAYMVPERVMADRVQAENDRREAIRAAAGEVLATVRGRDEADGAAEAASPREPELAVAAA
jgi:hypothetical protein